MEQLSVERLQSVAPLLRFKVMEAASILEKEGIFIRVASGLRTIAEQDKLYAQGRTAPGNVVTKAKGGYSNHNFGMAVDCYPFAKGNSGSLVWDEHDPKFQAMIKAMKNVGLQWGGDWKSIHDAPHFQLKNVPAAPTEEDRATLTARGMSSVWNMYKADKIEEV